MYFSPNERSYQLLLAILHLDNSGTLEWATFYKKSSRISEPSSLAAFLAIRFGGDMSMFGH
jgi:hypothetical protein